MKTKIIITLLLVLAGILIVGCNVELPCDPGPCIQENETNSTDSLIAPQEVLNKYEELDIQYKNSIGVFLESCNLGERRIFIVIGSGGFSGVNYYYDIEGKNLGTYVWDDIVEPNEPGPPFNLYIGDTRCNTLKQSNMPITDPQTCSSNSDCECDRFDGVDFQPGTSEGTCNLETNNC